MFIFLPIKRALQVRWLRLHPSWVDGLQLWRFSKEFAQGIVYPLTALFFGTGNQTPNISVGAWAETVCLLMRGRALFLLACSWTPI